MARTGERLSYAELDDRSRRLSRLLYDAGLRRGDVIALFTDNALPAFEVYWAAMRSGLYLTAVNSHLTADEAGYIIADSGARDAAPGRTYPGGVLQPCRTMRVSRRR